jgi:hypothetical protein
MAREETGPRPSKGAQGNDMFVRVGVGECAIIVVLLLILIVGLVISIRLRRQ